MEPTDGLYQKVIAYGRSSVELENAVKMGANVPAWLVSILKASANLVESAGDHIIEGDTEGHNEVAADEVRLE